MADWDDLRRELDLWAGAGETATFWWRDDDAGPADGRLDALLGLRRALAVPLALAVVPAWLAGETAAAIGADPGTVVLQHGCDHRNRAGEGRRKRELAAEALGNGLEDCLAMGRSVLDDAFGSGFHAVMVPPWNRIDPEVAVRLAGLGFAGLSTLGPRAVARSDGLAVANVHVDIVAWRAGGGFVGEAAALGAACDHLAHRRTGTVAPGEPTGLMTHHRVHDDACDRFVARMVAVVRDHPAGRWLDAGSVFAAA